MFKSVDEVRALEAAIEPPTSAQEKATLAGHFEEAYDNARDILDAILGASKRLNLCDENDWYFHRTPEGQEALQEIIDACAEHEEWKAKKAAA